MVPSVADKWRDIGVHLLDATLVEDRVLEVITANHPHSVEDCCKSMFEKWRNGSWNQLIEVLNIIKLDYIANKLEKSLTGNYMPYSCRYLIYSVCYACTMNLNLCSTLKLY